jgi:hypothetical protein
MRLLHVHTLEFRQFERDPPRYAIASHRWPAGQEATIEDVRNRHGRITNKSGYKKIQGFAEYVRKHIPHVDWLWIDTCCVNQDSSQGTCNESIILPWDGMIQHDVSLRQ